jgi:uncharacterized protein YuzE
MLRVTHDPDVNASYIYLTGSTKPGEVKRTISATPEINLDLDASGHLIGIELLGAGLLHPSLAAVAHRPGPAK